MKERIKGIHIISTGSAVPKCEYTNDVISSMVDTNDEWIQTRTGIKNRYICKEESCVSLAIEAARRAFDKAGIDKSEIGTVIVATSTGDYAFPSVACLTAKALGLSRDVLAFDLSAACSGFLFGMEVCRNYLSNHPGKYALLIGAEQLSRIIDYTDRSTCILFGDGAGAVILQGAEQTYFHQSGSDADVSALSCRGLGFEDQYVHMNGNAVFRFAVKTLRECIDRVLACNDITLDQVDYVICHQANARIIDHVKKKYKGYEDKFCMNLEKYGNTSAASIPILIDELYEEKKLQSGMKVICVGFGAGLTWGSVYIEV